MPGRNKPAKIFCPKYMKPKILFILHLPPPVHGAALVGSFVKSSIKINNTFECDFINLSASKSIESIGKMGLRKVFFFIQLLLNTLKALVKKKYAFCYVTITSNGTAFYKDFFVVLILKIFRKKILLHFHNKGVEAGSKASKINRILYKILFGSRKLKVILLSNYLYYDVKEYVDQKRVYYCANGIPTASNSCIPERTTDQVPRILFLSNMMVAKGVFVLLEACNLLKQRNVQFECHFVGDWLDISEAFFHQRVKELNLTDHVYAYGKKYGKEKDVFYMQSDIFVLPTLNEAFGLVLLEAMQSGLPVITTDEGGGPEIVTHNETGYVIQKNDSRDLASKLETLITNPLLRQTMGQAGREKFEEKFTLPRFEDRITGIFNDFAGAA